MFPESYFEENPLDRMWVSNSELLDASGITISKAGAGKQVIITATLCNHQQVSQDYAFIVQVKNEQGVVFYLSWQQGTIGAGATTDISMLWTPDAAGEHTIQIFVLDGLGASPVPLSTVTADIVQVTE